MAVLDFPRSTYSDTSVQQRAITDVVSLVRPTDTPLIAYLGGLNGKPGAGWRIQESNTKVEWLERDLVSLDDTVPSGGWTNAATTLSVNDASIYQAGDVLKVEGEHIWVSSVNVSSNQLTVVRGFAGTTAAAHAQGTAIAIVGVASLEDASAPSGSFASTDIGYNITEIFTAGVSVTPSAQRMSYFGDSGIEVDTRLAAQRLMLKIERALIYGIRNEPSGLSAARALGGLNYFINQAGGNVISNVGVLSLSAFEDAMALIYEDSASLPSTALMSMRNAQRCLNMFENYAVTIPRTETTAGMNIRRIVTMYGELDILIDRHMPNDTIFLINKEHLAIYPLIEMSWIDLARDGLPIKRMVFTELTLLVRHALKAHGALTGITA